MHSNVSPEEQIRVFEPIPPARTRVVLSTNIAESSLTIPFVTVVIDFGRTKQLVYEEHAGRTRVGRMERVRTPTLQLQLASKANCTQRRGRAGRTQGGVCFRLFSQAQFLEVFEDYSTPEITRIPLDALTLHILAVGHSPFDFYADAIDPPKQEAIEASLVNLIRMDAVIQIGAAGCDNPHPIQNPSTSEILTNEFSVTPLKAYRVTALGHAICALPLPPHLGRVLLLSILFGCYETVLTFVSIQEVGSVFSSSVDSKLDIHIANEILSCGTLSDHMVQVNAYNQWRALRRGLVVGNDEPEQVLLSADWNSISTTYSVPNGNSLTEFLKENSLNPRQLTHVDRIRKQLHAACGRILPELIDSRSSHMHASDSTVALRPADHNFNLEMVKGLLCSLLSPNLAIEWNKEAQTPRRRGFRSHNRFRTKSIPEAFVPEGSVVHSPHTDDRPVPSDSLVTPYVMYTELRSHTHLGVTLQETTRISIWSILIFGSRQLEYRSDLRLCVIEDWIMVLMSQEEFEFVYALQCAIRNAAELILSGTLLPPFAHAARSAAQQDTIVLQTAQWELLGELRSLTARVVTQSALFPVFAHVVDKTTRERSRPATSIAFIPAFSCAKKK